jgi:ERCC4-type nuclease
MGVQWYQAWDEQQAADRIVFLDKYAKGNKKFEMKADKRRFHVRDERLKLLMMFPNIGTQKKGEVLLEKYKTIDTIIQYAIQHPKEMEKELKGTRIGRDTIDKISDIATSEKEVYYETRTSPEVDISEGNNVLPAGPTKVSSPSNFYRRRKNYQHPKSAG